MRFHEAVARPTRVDPVQPPQPVTEADTVGRRPASFWGDAALDLLSRSAGGVKGGRPGRPWSPGGCPRTPWRADVGSDRPISAGIRSLFWGDEGAPCLTSRRSARQADLRGKNLFIGEARAPLLSAESSAHRVCGLPASAAFGRQASSEHGCLVDPACQRGVS